MADPCVPRSMIDGLRRDAVHSQDIARALESLREACGREQIPFAVIGALAMRVHGFVRHTEDIDVVTTREGLERIHERFVGRGFVPRGPGLRKKLRDTVHKVDVDVIAAGEHAGSPDSPVVFPEPDSAEFGLISDGVRYATLPTLLTLKLAAGIWGRRHLDLADVIRLIQSNQLTESFASELPEPVRAKFVELVQSAREEIDIE